LRQFDIDTVILSQSVYIHLQ